MPKICFHKLFLSSHKISNEVRISFGLIIIAILILLIAVVNNINLTTARAVNRAKEVALRKSMGAKRIQLIFQFLGETILYSIIVFAISMLAVELLMPTPDAEEVPFEGNGPGGEDGVGE